MNMKICTITCQNADNQGARLQTYALAKFLNGLGHQTEVINYRPSYLSFKVKLLYWPGYSLKQWAKLLLQFNGRRTAIHRHQIFVDFSKEYIPLTKKIYKSHEDLHSNPPEADVYIAGSDQIWNTEFPNGTDPAFYLDFGNKRTKRISYAASFATPALANNAETFVRNHLMRFDSISVREVSGLKILHSLGFNGRLVIDPVFLLPAEAWRKMTMTTKKANKRYILIYDFLNSYAIKQIAKRLAHLTHCLIYSISPRKLGYADKNFVYASPIEFVELVQNAQCVISNSFHGTAFAMIFQRDFFVVKREDGLNDRMNDLLARYGLSERMISTSVNDTLLTSKIDYTNVTHQINLEVLASKKYLSECLQQ